MVSISLTTTSFVLSLHHKGNRKSQVKLEIIIKIIFNLNKFLECSEMACGTFIFEYKCNSIKSKEEKVAHKANQQF